MTALSMVLVLGSGLLHATWNYLAKKCDDKFAFVWLFHVAGLVLFFPFFLNVFEPGAMSPLCWFCLLTTGIIHAFYFGFLSRAYEQGSLSIVYPIARGTGPCLVTFLAIVFLGESVCPLAGAGIVGVTLGMVLIHLPLGKGGGKWKEPLGRSGVVWAILTGTCGAFYSLVDKIGVSLVNPFVYVYLLFLGSWFFLSLFGILVNPWHHWKMGSLVREWRKNWWNVIGVGVLCITAYLMVLAAMVRTQLSYVVPLRESGILFSLVFGLFFLKEPFSWRRFWGAVLIFGGIVAIGSSN